MNWLSKAVRSRKRGAALLIVLALVVLLTGVGVAYLSRTTSDRQVAHSSFNQSNSDQLAQSAMENIIGDLQQEIINGSTATIINDGVTIYTPTATANTTAAANMIPQRSGNAAGAPNLVRRSVRSDPILSPPGVGSRASAVNSTNPADASANGRTVTSTRWNSHYLVPKGDITTSDSSPIPAFTNATPDWVFVTNSGATIIAAPDSSVIGRYAYAVYDEGGLLDMNVAGYPTNTTAIQSGRKGSVAFADLTALPTAPVITQPQINSIVGWRNCASAQPSGNFPAFTFTATQATNYVNSVLSNSDGFMRVRATRSDGTDNVWVSGSGGGNAAKRTDQMFPDRRSLMDFRMASGFNVNALQYLGTFSRETNSPSFSPATPTAINPNFLLARATTSFTRFDGTIANIGDPLLNTRFPLSRLAWLTYKGPSASLAITDPAITQLTNPPNNVPLSTIKAGTAANIKACFGLVWDSRTPQPVPSTSSPIGQQWVYDSPSSANTGGNFDPNSNANGNPASDIKTLDVVTSENREPDFFELLRATILDGSLGQNTGGGVSRSTSEINNNLPVFPDVHMSNKALHILTIGACIIDQADPDSIPTRIQLMPPNATAWWAAFGIESLPYITQIYPITGISPADPTKWATYLLFQLWNPHVGGALPTPAPQVRVRVDGGVGIFTGGNNQTWPGADGKAMAATGQSIALTTGAFPSTGTPTPAPLGTPGVASVPLVGSATPPCGFERLPGNDNVLKNYVGLRLLPPTLPASHDFTLAPAGNGQPKPQLTLCFGRDGSNNPAPFNATMEYNLPGSSPPIWVPYNYFIGINNTASWINGDTVPVHNAASAAGTPDPRNNSPDQFSSNNPNRLADAPLPDSLMKSDPRSTRFGIFQFRQPSTWTTTRITDPLWPTNNSTVPNGYGGATADPPDDTHPVEHAPCRFAGCPPATPTPTPTSTPQPYFPATFAINGSPDNVHDTATTIYADNDGIVRPADAVYLDPSVTTTGSSTPYYITATAGSGDYHPIILNRPFRNVAELGYAFRDLPWKTLDFFTDKSADAGLLDIFTTNDGPALFDSNGNFLGMGPVPTMVAGQVNLSGQQAPVLQSILAGAILDEVNTTTVAGTGTSATCAPVIAQNIVTETSMPTPTVSPTPCPLTNRSELVTRPGLLNYILPVPASGAAHDQRVKSRREALVRAVSSVSQTRTWNLLIDVIAQSGRYPPNATNFRNGFVVEGEQRYWVHVVIDRFTGEVIDKQIEVVNE